MPVETMTLIRLLRVGSTQDWLRTWAELGAREGLAVQAGAQTSGRGRLQREWWSPPGDGLYISTLLRPAITLAQAAHVTMLVSLAAIEACETVAGLSPQPKWPNDLLLHGRKLAGVLTELQSTSGRLDYALVGLGLNVNGQFAGGKLAETAISLGEAGGRALAVNDVAEAYLAALHRRYQRFLVGESPLAEWRARLWPLGQRVRVREGSGGIVGIAEDVSAEGALLLRDEAGVRHSVWAGDVVIA